MIYRIIAVAPLLVLGALAQDEPATRKVTVSLSEMVDNLKEAKVMAIGGAVMGPAVKNGPYSATEVTETTQTLADGNRIHRQNQVPVYRDSEGRVRRENSPDQIMIWDPVANTSYVLNPKTQTARKLPLAMKFFAEGPGPRVATGGGVMAFKEGPGPKVVTGGAIAFNDGSGEPPPPSGDVVFARVAGGGEVHLQIVNGQKLSPKRESLGKQMIEGVNADGTRLTTTLEAGSIGNDRPIQITSETWYSPDLQTMVKSVHSDPRNGEEVFQLINISRAEPPSTLFQVPAEYQVTDQKLPGGRGAAAR